MKCNFVGKRRVDYVSKKTGRQVLGWNLYVTHDEGQTDGVMAESLYVPDAFRVSAQVGDLVEVTFNRYGGVESFAAIM